jgi:hypothetical protein
VKKESNELQRVIWCSDLTQYGAKPSRDRRKLRFLLTGMEHCVLYEAVIEVNGAAYRSFWTFIGVDEKSSTSYELFGVDPKACAIGRFLATAPEGMRVVVEVELALVGKPSTEWVGGAPQPTLGLIKAVKWFRTTVVD